jgi:hypothetical protein
MGLAIDLPKGLNIWLVVRVLSDEFLHPHHIVPTVKFVTAFMKMRHNVISVFFMEINAVICKIPVLALRIGYAGV